MTALRFLVLVTALAAGLPLVYSGSYLYDAILTPFLALSLAALGLNLLTGYAGQVSLGSSAFMAIGAYSAYNLTLRIPGLPLVAILLASGGITAAIGLVFGLPSLRLRGFYLAVSTLAAQFFVQWALNKFGWFSHDSASGVISAPALQAFGFRFESPVARYDLSLAVVVLLTALAFRLSRSQTGLNLIAIRDHETAARVIGVSVVKTKLLAFLISSFLIGVAGVLWSFAYLRTIEPNGFTLDRSFQILFIIIIGGVATIRGAFIGAAFMVLLPLGLSNLGAALLPKSFDSGVLEMSLKVVQGSLIVLFLIVEPNGLAALGQRLWRRALPVRSGSKPDAQPFAPPLPETLKGEI